MHPFQTRHPLVNLIYFIGTIGFSMVFLSPVTLGISLVTGFFYALMLRGPQALKTNLLYPLPLVMATALFNPLFNHQGVTTLCYFPDGNPLTLEALLYGMAAGGMLWSVVCHCSCLNQIMTGDKLMYLLGRTAPALSMLFSIVLRFVPKFGTQLRAVSNAQRGLCQDVSQRSLLQKVRHSIHLLSIVITWSFEHAIDTADSMKSRGYGLPNRTAYTNYKLSRHDWISLCYLLLLFGYVLAGGAMGVLSFNYFPNIQSPGFTPYIFSVYLAYALLFAYPILLEVQEVFVWNKLTSNN